jgi:hypothetical protein
MNNNVFAHVYSNAEHSTVHAYDFYHTWKHLATSIRKTAAGTAEITMKNNDVHVFLSDILYPRWCCGKTYYMDGILYRGEYPFYSNRSEEKNIGLFDREIEIDKAGKEGYEAAMEEAHYAMNELFNLDYETRKSIFGSGFADEVVKNYDIRTIIGKLYAYEQKSVMIGKEYIHTDNKQKVIVTDILSLPNVKYVYFLNRYGTSDYLPEKEFGCKFEETGKTYPELVAFLNKVEGSES